MKKKDRYLKVAWCATRFSYLLEFNKNGMPIGNGSFIYSETTTKEHLDQTAKSLI